MTHPLRGKVAIVTGASRGIGAAIAARLATEGAHVTINHCEESYAGAARDAAALMEDILKAGGQGRTIEADMADRDAAAHMVKTVIRDQGRLDILINNAGIFVRGKIDDPDPDLAGFDRQFAINVGSVAATTRAAAAAMEAGGRIIIIGSSSAARVPIEGIADYAAGKAALVGYCRGWARDLGGRGITVNIIQPGAIATAINPPSGALARDLCELAALKRLGEPGDIAGAVSYLAGPDGGYVTGSILTVDGGQIT